MKAIFKYILIVFICTIASRSYAQTYPVTVNTQLIPPYSVYLSDYVSPEGEKLFVSLLLNDATTPNYNVKLQLTIEGVGIKIQSRPDAYYPPITITSGMMERLGASELAPYFNPDNLIFQGITKEQYQRNAALPEGLYKFTVQVMDYHKNIAISNRSFTQAWIILNDPPRIVSPICKSTIRVIYPQNVVFQWLPMHLSSPNASFNTEYHFRLVHIIPSGKNPNDAILTSPPIYEAVTSIAVLYYGISEPQLIPGQQYAWRVQAKDKGGKDLFKNSGFSEVCMFTYGDPCTAPANIRKEVQSPQRARISWDQMFGPSGYKVRYRQKGINSPWYEDQTYQNSATISNLKANTVYEYQVQSLCDPVESSYSNIDTFSTQSASGFQNCGVPVPPKTVESSNPLEVLYPNDVLMVDGFRVRVTDATGSNGVFSGKGVAYIPFISTYVLMTFNGVKVNSSYEVYQGKVISTRANLTKYRPVSATPALRNDICQDVADDNSTNNKNKNSDKNKEVKQQQTVKDSIKVFVINGNIEIKEGDTITVNGRPVVVTKDTQINPGDVVVVRGETVTVRTVESRMIPNPALVSPEFVANVKTLIENLRNSRFDSLTSIKGDFQNLLGEYNRTSNSTLSTIGSGQSSPLFMDTTMDRTFKPIRLTNQNNNYIDTKTKDFLSKEKSIFRLLLYIATANNILIEDKLTEFAAEVKREQAKVSNSNSDNLEQIINKLLLQHTNDY